MRSPPRPSASRTHSYGTATPSARAKAYRVLHAIMTTAADDDQWIGANPCRVRKGGSDPRSRRITVADPEQVAAIADGMRPEWRMLVLLAAWTTLRFGELSELRRADVDLERGVLMVTRAVSCTDAGLVAGPPKSEAGIRDVTVPEFLLGDLAAHLAAHAQPGPGGLLFTTPNGGQLYQPCMFREWDRARTAAGRADLRFHDLRHTGATWAAEEGATTKQLMRRLGHANPTMAMLYQHATDRGDAQVAARLCRARRKGHSPAEAQGRHCLNLGQSPDSKAGQPSHLGSAGPLGVQAGYAWGVSWALASALALEVLGALAEQLGPGLLGLGLSPGSLGRVRLAALAPGQPTGPGAQLVSGPGVLGRGGGPVGVAPDQPGRAALGGLSQSA